MAKRSVVLYTVGEAGSGKSYARVQYLMTFLKEHKGNVYTNLPLGLVPESHAFPPKYEGERFTHRIAKAVAHDLKKKDQWEEIEKRIVLIPKEELARWNDNPIRKDQLKGEPVKGIWQWLEDKDLSDSLIIIDEIHNWYSELGTPKYVCNELQKYLGEIRHRGAMIEFISQSANKVAKCIKQEAGEQIEIQSSHHRRDPLFKISMHDWHELIASVTRSWQPAIYVDHYRYRGSRLKRAHTDVIRVIDDGFRYYDSFSAPEAGGQSGKVATCEWQKRSIPSLWLWFYCKNFMQLLKPTVVLIFFIWLLPFGGAGWIATKYFETTSLMSPVAAARKEESNPNEALPIQESNAPVVSSSQAALPAQVDTERIQRLVADKALVEREISRLSAVAMIQHQSVVFRNGERVQLGNEIKFGTFKNRTLLEIDYEARTCTLDDGTLLRLGRVSVDQAKPSTSDNGNDLQGTPNPDAAQAPKPRI